MEGTTNPLWLEKVTEYGIDYGLNIVWVIVLFVVGRWVAGRFAKMTARALDRAKVDSILSQFASNMVRYAIIAFTAVACLEVFGVKTTSFVAILGAAGLAVGLALQGTLANFASGVMLLLFRPFKVGDSVNAGGIAGKVQQLQIFSTVLLTPDNVRITVPNGQIYGAVIKNMTAEEHRRVDVGIGVAYDADIDQAKQIMIDTVSQIDGVLVAKGVAAYLSELGASSVDFSVRAWCAPADYWAVREQMLRQCKQALDAAEIGIPFPQLDLHFVSNQTIASAPGAAA